MNKKWNWIFTLVLLISFMFSGHTQLVLAQTSPKVDFSLGTTPGKLIVGSLLSEISPIIAEFIFESSQNPTYLGQEVTFTLSATGNDSTYQPFGYIDFYDNDVIIPSCQSVGLNYSNGNPLGGNPAQCTTSLLAAGEHDIKAEFNSALPFVYPDETITLDGGHYVNDPIPLTIEPTTFSDAMISVYTRFFLTAYYPGGIKCENCNWWTTNGELPDGVGLNSSTGEMMGTPTTLGTYNFIVQVDDGDGAHGSKEYTWDVTKVKTKVSVGNSYTTVGNTNTITLGAEAQHLDPDYSNRPTGKISFSVDGVPVPGCSGSNAITTDAWGSAYCQNFLPTDLEAGSYPIKADFTPDISSSGIYDNGSGAGTLQVKEKPNIDLYISTPTYYGHKFNINAVVMSGNYHVPGTVDFSIDGEAVASCQNVTQNSFSEYFCQDVSLLLAVGVHTLSADFTPTDTSTYDYGSDNIPFTVDSGSYIIQGFVFEDTDQSGSMTTSEYGLFGWSVQLKTCDGQSVLGTDGNIINTKVTGYMGVFTFNYVPGGLCIRVSEVVQPGWQPTTSTQVDLTLSQDVYPINFGIFYPHISVSVEGSPLPNGEVGKTFSSTTFTANGGEGPYTFFIQDGDLPNGLELSSDGILSGTPTIAGNFFFSVAAEDQNLAVGYQYYYINISEKATYLVFLPLIGN